MYRVYKRHPGRVVLGDLGAIPHVGTRSGRWRLLCAWDTIITRLDRAFWLGRPGQRDTMRPTPSMVQRYPHDRSQVVYGNWGHGMWSTTGSGLAAGSRACRHQPAPSRPANENQDSGEFPIARYEEREREGGREKKKKTKLCLSHGPPCENYYPPTRLSIASSCPPASSAPLGEGGRP